MRLLRLFILALFLIPALSFADEFVAGKDYELINNAASNSSQSIAVTEFFSYACPWCSRIDPLLMNWVKKQGDKINFSRVPVIFHKDWALYAKAYYTAHLLGLDDKLNPLLFNTIQDKTKPLNNNELMIAFFIAHGVDPAITRSAFEHSTTIDMQINEGNALMAKNHVTGVPAIVINNQFKTDLQMAQNETRFLEILDFLVAKAGKR